MSKAPATSSTTESVWESICQELRDNVPGAIIHPALELQEISSTLHRGVFSNEKIAQNEVLIRLPFQCAIHGQDMPFEYTLLNDTSVKRHTSTWLRCLASFYKYRQQALHSAYLDSLPTHYETLWEWTFEQTNNFLSGTTPAMNIIEDANSSSSWYVDSEAIRSRYVNHIQPYLEYCRLDASDFDFFAYACQTLSTRAFHLSTSDETYPGPYLLPVIDLLNHSSSDAVTTLQFQDDCFVMIAERDIPAGMEITHSYGEHLTASQSLQTFGFVSHDDTLAALRNNLIGAITPVVLSKQQVLESCWKTIESDVPRQLAHSMEEQELEDEAWPMPTNYRERPSDFLPDNLLVTVECPLPDDLVTAASLSFLPVCAYHEARQSRLDASLLEDYFLGKLVSTSLLQVISDRLRQYQTIVWKGKEYSNDADLLKELVETTSKTPNDPPDLQENIRLTYALTVRLQEKQSLHALRRRVVGILAQLEEEEDDDEMGEEDPRYKKQRI